MSVDRYHNPRFDPIRNEAHAFAAHQLGLSVAPKENIALVTQQQAVEARALYGKGWGVDIITEIIRP